MMVNCVFIIMMLLHSPHHDCWNRRHHHSLHQHHHIHHHNHQHHHHPRHRRHHDCLTVLIMSPSLCRFVQLKHLIILMKKQLIMITYRYIISLISKLETSPECHRNGPSLDFRDQQEKWTHKHTLHVQTSPLSRFETFAFDVEVS